MKGEDLPSQDLQQGSHLSEDRPSTSTDNHSPASYSNGPNPSVQSSPRDKQLRVSIEASASEVALMWLLHWWSLPVEGREPLELQIEKFSSEVLERIRSRFPVLQDAEPHHLWLIYFKGLLAANTHSRSQMVQAINALQNQQRNIVATSKPPQDADLDERGERTASEDPNSDAELLQQISLALRQTGGRDL